jgi:hypothetical protein
MRQMPRLFMYLIVPCLASCSYTPRAERLPETGATLEGTVTYAGQKVPAALVIAQGSSGSANTFVSEDGHYKLDNVPLGEVSLAVNTNAGKGRMMSQVMAQSQGKSKAPPKAIDVPAKYADPSTADIKVTIHKGENKFDIVIPK